MSEEKLNMTTDELAEILLTQPEWQSRCICAAIASIPMVPRNPSAGLWEFIKPHPRCPLAYKAECLGVRGLMLTVDVKLERSGWNLADSNDRRTRRRNLLSYYGEARNGGYVICPYFMQTNLPYSERRTRAESMRGLLKGYGLKSRIDSADYIFIPFDQTAEPVPDCEARTNEQKG